MGPLIFDEAQGACVREEQASSFARKCERNATKPNIDGFSVLRARPLDPMGSLWLTHPSLTQLPAENTSSASSRPHPRSWAALTAWCSTTSTTSVSTLRTDQKTVPAGTPAQRAPSAQTAVTRTAPVPDRQR